MQHVASVVDDAGSTATLRFLDGSVGPIVPDRGEDVGSLRSRLAETLGAPPEAVVLVAGDAILPDDRQMVDSICEDIIQVTVSCNSQFPELLDASSFSKVAPLFDGMTALDLSAAYSRIVDQLAQCRIRCGLSCTFLRCGAHSFEIDLFYICICGFQCVAWSGFVALTPSFIGSSGVSAVQVIEEKTLSEGLPRIFKEVTCSPLKLERQMHTPWDSPVSISGSFDVTRMFAAPLWKAACEGRLFGNHGISMLLALVMLQSQQLFSSCAKVPEVLCEKEDECGILKLLRQCFQNASSDDVHTKDRIYLCGGIPAQISSPMFEVHHDGQWVEGGSVAVAQGRDCAVRVHLLCCADFGGVYWSMGSFHYALLDVVLEVSGPEVFSLCTRSMASAECYGIPMS